MLPTGLIFNHPFLSVWQSPVQLDDFDSYIKDMAKDSDYKFSLQFEVSGEAVSPFWDGRGMGMVGFTVGSLPCSMGGTWDILLRKEGYWFPGGVGA